MAVEKAANTERMRRASLGFMLASSLDVTLCAA